MRSLVLPRPSQRFSTIAPLEHTLATRESVLFFDSEEGGYFDDYTIVEPFERAFHSHPGLRIVDNRITIDYSDGIAPNMAIPVFRTDDHYVSVYQDRVERERVLIYSHDLTRWERSSIVHPAPILLFERDGGLFALTSSEVWDVSDPEAIEFVREVPEPIMQPDVPVERWYPRDNAVFYSFNVDDFLLVHFRRSFDEGSGTQKYFLTIDMTDLSFRLAADEADVIGGYNYKAVEREDGWKVYYIGRDPADGIWVLDPFAEDGPAIIEQLPGVNVP